MVFSIKKRAGNEPALLGIAYILKRVFKICERALAYFQIGLPERSFNTFFQVLRTMSATALGIGT